MKHYLFLPSIGIFEIIPCGDLLGKTYSKGNYIAVGKTLYTKKTH